MLYYCPQITVNVPARAKNRNSLADFSPYNMLYITVSPPLSLCLLCMQVMQLLGRVISQVAIVELGWQQIVWIFMCIPMYCLHNGEREGEAGAGDVCKCVYTSWSWGNCFSIEAS